MCKSLYNMYLSLNRIVLINKYNSNVIYSQCATSEHYAQIEAPKEPGTKWKQINGSGHVDKISPQAFDNLICNNIESKVAALQILPPLKNYNSIIVYDNCPANAHLALTRQCKAVPTPDLNMLKLYHQFCDRIFEEEIVNLLENFEYSFSKYYNHLTRTQQLRLSKVNEYTITQKHYYTIFCKREKQIIENGELPKNRCICGPCEEYKFTVAPVIYKLEAIFKRDFKGYRSGLSWSDTELITNQYIKQGYKHRIAFDVSQYDACMRNSMRYMELKIYKYLYTNNKIWHTNPDDFDRFVQSKKMLLRLQCSNKLTKSLETLATAELGTKRCSGDPQTTFGNTVNMIMPIRFIMEHQMGLPSTQYMLKIAGDDGEVLHRDSLLDNRYITKKFYEVFTPHKNQVVFGLGLSLKYLKFGDAYDSDFCSTESFHCEKCGFKIIRMLSRFIALMPYSLKIDKLTLIQQLIYLKALKESNDFWIGNLPIFKQYNELLYHKAVLNVNLIMPPKFSISPDKYDDNVGEQLTPALSILKQLDPDTFYSTQTRVSSKCEFCVIGFKKMLNIRYGISDINIDNICKQISAITDPYTQVLDSPDLLFALKYREGYNNETS